MVQTFLRSAQEPRLLAHMCNEKSLKETFAEGRDPYATVSSLVFHKDYWECMEHHQDGTDNPEGKKLRKKAKAIFLGLLYGMGAKLLSTMLGVSVDECKEILNEFYKMFPNIRDFTVQNEANAKELGYVEDYLGRRRHLPDAQKQELEIKVRTPVVTEADVLFDIPKEDCMINVLNKELTAMWNDKYEKAVSSGRFYAKQNFKEEAKQNNVDVMDNGGFISKTMTQCTNARIQGCISGNSLILTKESGISDIKSLSNKSVTVWDGREWSSAEVLPSGLKRKCVVTFSNGHQFICSPDHKFGRVPISAKLEKDLIFTPCSDLKIGDRIRVSEFNFTDTKNYISAKNDSSTHNAHNYYLDMIDDSFLRGVFLGRLASDGSIFNRDVGSKSVRFIIAEHERDVVNKLLKFIPYEYTLSSRLRDGRNQTIYYIDIYSKTLVEEILSFNIKSHIDDRLFRDTAMLRGFLCGMFDGDGTATHGHINLTFGTQNDFSKYISDIQKALLFFGVRSSIHKYKSCHRINIYKQDARKFVERIGFFSDEKRSLSEGIIAIKDGHIFKDVVVVKDVAFTDEYIDMYDVCNTERGFFVADGIVTHNSAASLTKKAMIALANDEKMKKWGFRILIPVHDELLCECKKEYAEECSKRLVELMVNSALPECSVGMKCDPYTVKHWYADEVSSSVYNTYEKLLSKGSTKEEAFEKICSDYEEVKREVLKKMCDGTFDPATEDV